MTDEEEYLYNMYDEFSFDTNEEVWFHVKGVRKQGKVMSCKGNTCSILLENEWAVINVDKEIIRRFNVSVSAKGIQTASKGAIASATKPFSNISISKHNTCVVDIPPVLQCAEKTPSSVDSITSDVHGSENFQLTLPATTQSEVKVEHLTTIGREEDTSLQSSELDKTTEVLACNKDEVQLPCIIKQVLSCYSQSAEAMDELSSGDDEDSEDISIAKELMFGDCEGVEMADSDVSRDEGNDTSEDACSNTCTSEAENESSERQTHHDNEMNTMHVNR